MTTVTFDTHSLIKELREADFSEKQAETVVRVLARSQERLVTVEHFDNEMKLMRMEMNSRFTLQQWMLALIIAATVLPLLKNLL